MPEHTHDRTVLWAYAAVAMTAFCWSGNWIVGRGLHDVMSPLGLSFWRWTATAVLFLPFVLPAFWRERAIIKQEFPRLLVFGFIGALAFNSMVYWGLRSTAALNGALLNSVQPIFVLIIGGLWFGQRYSWRMIAGMMISFTGVVITLARGDLEVLLGLQFGFGDMIILVAIFIWGLYSVLLKAWPTKLSPTVFFASTIVFGLPMIVPFYLMDPLSPGPIVVSKEIIAGVLYLAISGSIIAYLCWNYGVRIVGAARASVFLHLIPIFTAIQAIILLGEKVHVFHMVGIALILSGIYAATAQKPFWRR